MIRIGRMDRQADTLGINIPQAIGDPVTVGEAEKIGNGNVIKPAGTHVPEMQAAQGERYPEQPSADDEGDAMVTADTIAVDDAAQKREPSSPASAADAKNQKKLVVSKSCPEA